MVAVEPKNVGAFLIQFNIVTYVSAFVGTCNE